MAKVRTFLMFQGEGEKAVQFYSSVFSDFRIEKTEKYGEGEPAPAGSFKTATVNFADHQLTILDSPPMHDFDFTPSISLFVDFENDEELSSAFDQLSQAGKVMMPLDNYGFSKKFAWIADRFGVSWQLNLPN